jgi:endonuclease YncB( thermonuclease family)
MEQAGFLVRDTWDDFSEHRQAIPALGTTGLRGRVTRVIDGDSLRLSLEGGGRWEARLYGIDAPEHDQPHGPAAERALAWKVLWREVDIEVVDVDSYGRQVVLLYRRSGNINLQMVCEGHAWWYVRYAPDDTELKGCQNLARVQKLGLWAAGDPVPPWEWRETR